MTNKTTYASARAVKIRKQMKAVIEDKKAGKTYKAGMNAPKGEEKVDTKKSKGPPVPCKHCGNFGHVKRSHRLCGKTTYKPKGK
jgi:ribosomal protein L32